MSQYIEWGTRIAKLLTIVVPQVEMKMAFTGIGIYKAAKEKNHTTFQHIALICSASVFRLIFHESFLFTRRSDLITKIIINLMLHIFSRAIHCLPLLAKASLITASLIFLCVSFVCRNIRSHSVIHIYITNTKRSSSKILNKMLKCDVESSNFLYDWNRRRFFSVYSQLSLFHFRVGRFKSKAYFIFTRTDWKRWKHTSTYNAHT